MDALESTTPPQGQDRDNLAARSGADACLLYGLGAQPRPPRQGDEQGGKQDAGGDDSSSDIEVVSDIRKFTGEDRCSFVVDMTGDVSPEKIANATFRRRNSGDSRERQDGP